jgi:hypothetical protein
VPQWYYNYYPSPSFPIRNFVWLLQNYPDIAKQYLRWDFGDGKNYLSSESSSKFTSTWFLSKVTSPIGNETTFNYESETVLSDAYPSVSYRGYGSDDPNQELEIENTTVNYQEGLKQPRMETKRLKSIETNDYCVDFNTEINSRDDLRNTYNATTPKALDKIVIKKKNGLDFINVRVFDFYQHYSCCGSSEFVYNDESTSVFRLILDSITELNGSIRLKPFIFSYNNPDNLPSRYTCETDIWGFYKVTNTYETIPKVYVYPLNNGSDRFRYIPDPNYIGEYYELPGVDRSPNTSYYDDGTLESITLPSGGSVNYEFEPHSYLYDDYEYQGIGLRIKKITINDGSSENDLIVNYNYTKNGVPTGRILKMPVFGHFDPVKYQTNYNEIEDYYNYSFVRYSNDISDYSEGTVMYTNVSVIRNDQRKSEFNFNVPYPYQVVNDGSEDFIVNTEWNRSDDDILSHQVILQYLHFYSYSYPFPPNVNLSWNRGQLISQVEYGFEGGAWFKVESTYNHYNTFYKNRTEPEIVYGIKSGFLSNNCFDPNAEIRLEEPLAVYGKYPIQTGISSLLQKSTHVIYKMDSPIDSIYSELNYEYNTIGLLNKTILNNGEKIKITQTKYNFDYEIEDPGDEMTNSLQIMQDKHIVNIPIETITLIQKDENSLLVNSTLNLLKNFGTENNPMVLPEKTLNLEISKPLEFSLFNQSNISVGNFNYDYRYEFYSENKEFDTEGNLLESCIKNGLTNSTIFGPNNLPLAEISNSTYKEFCYEGYEDADEDHPYNWFNSTYSNLTIANNFWHSGNGSLKYISQPGASSASYVPKPFAAEDIDNNPKYKFSAWVYSVDIDDELKIFITINRTNNPPIYFTSNYDNLKLGVWQLLIVEVDLSDYSGITDVIPTICNTGSQSKPAYFDDIRFCPADAIMSTHNYDKLNRKTSSMGPNELPVFYEYDDLGRIIRTRDFEGYILSETNYYQNNQ